MKWIPSKAAQFWEMKTSETQPFKTDGPILELSCCLFKRLSRSELIWKPARFFINGKDTLEWPNGPSGSCDKIAWKVSFAESWSFESTLERNRSLPDQCQPAKFFQLNSFTKKKKDTKKKCHTKKGHQTIPEISIYRYHKCTLILHFFAPFLQSTHHVNSFPQQCCCSFHSLA